MAIEQQLTITDYAMNKLIKQLLPPLLTDLLKRAKYVRPHYFGLDNLDQKLEKYLDFDGGYFVELGANNGVQQSNTFYYERYRGWRGVLVEPTPHNYLLCRANRSRDTYIFCNACTSFDYKEKFVEVVYSNLMSTPIGLESDILDPFAHARSGKRLLRPTEENFVFGSLARPLNSILIEANAPHLIDFLSLDVEGAEIEVLRGIDHAKYKFKFMCVENRSKDKLTAFLATIRYKLIDQLSHRDYLFCSF